jgi:hypothetical protein
VSQAIKWKHSNFYEEVEKEEMESSELEHKLNQEEMMEVLEMAQSIAFKNFGINNLPEIPLEEHIQISMNYKQCKSFLEAYEKDPTKTKVGHPLKNQGVRGRKPLYDKDNPEILSIKKYCEEIRSIKPIVPTIDKDAKIMEYIQKLKTNKNARRNAKKQVKCSEYDINCVLNELESKYSISKVDFCEFIKKNKYSNEVVRELLKSNIFNYRNICNEIGITVGGSISQTTDQILLEEIPLMHLDTICETGSPFYTFLSFYSRLTPTINFFWFITYKTLFFMMFGDDMDRENCVRYKEMYSATLKQIAKNVGSTQENSKIKEVQRQTNSRINNNSKSNSVRGSSINNNGSIIFSKSKINSNFSFRTRNDGRTTNELISARTFSNEPSESATSFPEGTIKTGNDGNKYIVTVSRSNGGIKHIWSILQNAGKEKHLHQNKKKNPKV